MYLFQLVWSKLPIIHCDIGPEFSWSTIALLSRGWMIVSVCEAQLDGLWLVITRRNSHAKTSSQREEEIRRSQLCER